MEIVSCHIVFVYLDEQVASETELDEEPEEHASKHHFQHVAKAPYSCVSSILNLESTTTVHLMLPIQNWRQPDFLFVKRSHQVLFYLLIFDSVLFKF